MNRYALYHCGLDCKGDRHWRLKTASDMRHCRQQTALFPKVVVMTPVRAGRAVWRNGHHQRRWQAAVVQVRVSRRSFLSTLPKPSLVSAVMPTFP
jgi:hypothetical protein